MYVVLNKTLNNHTVIILHVILQLLQLSTSTQSAMVFMQAAVITCELPLCFTLSTLGLVSGIKQLKLLYKVRNDIYYCK